MSPDRNSSSTITVVQRVFKSSSFVLESTISWHKIDGGIRGVGERADEEGSRSLVGPEAAY